MKTKIKHLISIILSFAIIILTATVVTASEPRYSDTHSLYITLSFNGTTANCVVDLIGADGTTSITDGHLILTDSSGNVKGDWKNLTSKSDTLFASKSVSELTKGETYTLSFSANVKRNGNTEYVSGSKSETCPQK